MMSGKKLTRKIGTFMYMAPEILMTHNKEPVGYNEKCDIWSIGVILYMLLSGNPPFNGASDLQILEAVKYGEYTIDGGVWNEVSNSAKDLVIRMLA